MPAFGFDGFSFDMAAFDGVPAVVAALPSGLSIAASTGTRHGPDPGWSMGTRRGIDPGQSTGDRR